MSVSINNYLKNLSYSNYYIKRNSNERTIIRRSINFIIDNLSGDFPNEIRKVFLFGSYDRDTILPRNIDSRSDVDIMIVFNYRDFARTPETYRGWLQSFGNRRYSNRYGSEVVKTFPTVTIRLNNINYDLIPAVEEQGYFRSQLYIPDSNNQWRETDPKDVKDSLIEANHSYGGIVSPIIRLLKAWNCSNNYPYDSYELELAITRMNFRGDNIQTGFIYAARNLPIFSFDTLTRIKKHESLNYNIDKVEEELRYGDKESAIHWLGRVLP